MKISDLSIVILTNRNDSKFEQALNSAQFAQNILIIDNNSKNDWNDLQKKYQFEIIEHSKAIINFAKVRNKALESVKTTWVLFLDSDEILPKNAATEIKNIIENNTYDAVSIKRIDYFLGKPLSFGETGNILFIRLFKTEHGKFVRNVHERVEISGKLGSANFNISHFSHDSIKDFLAKITHYAMLESKNKSTNKNETFIQMCTFPIIKFILNYFVKLGFLDGYRGLIYAIMMSLHSFFVRVFRYENI